MLTGQQVSTTGEVQVNVCEIQRQSATEENTGHVPLGFTYIHDLTRTHAYTHTNKCILHTLSTPLTHVNFTSGYSWKLHKRHKGVESKF